MAGVSFLRAANLSVEMDVLRYASAVWTAGASSGLHLG